MAYDIDTLLTELIEVDPSLKGREPALRELLSELLATKPDAVMDPAFRERLGRQLRAQGALARPRLAGWRGMRLYYGLGTAALLVVLIIATRPAGEPTQVAFKGGSEQDAAAPAGAPETGDMKMMAATREASHMQLTTTAFQNGSYIPAHYTCDGAGAIPPLAWSGIPEGTKSLALFFEDQDSPGDRFVHWLVFNIDPATGDLANAPQGRTSTGKTGYAPPCPPPGEPHRYFFILYALDTVLDLKDGSVDSVGLWEVMKGHVLDESVLEGTYLRK